jgi:hypothetical protein
VRRVSNEVWRNRGLLTSFWRGGFQNPCEGYLLMSIHEYAPTQERIGTERSVTDEGVGVAEIGRRDGRESIARSGCRRRAHGQRI